MITFRKKNNGQNEQYSIEKHSLSTEDYLQKYGVDKNSFEVQENKSNLIEEFLENRGIDKNALRTVEGRKEARLKHLLAARMIILCSLTLPMIVIPFWLMWALSPANIKQYSEPMKAALLGALATDVVGLYWIITKDLFPYGNNKPKWDLESEEEEPDDE